MEDAAVKQEEWCIPEKKDDQPSDTDCEQYLSYNSVMGSRNMPYLELKQCETARRKILNQKVDKKERENKKCKSITRF